MALLSGIPVLIVEDEPLISCQLADELSDHGASIVGPFSEVDAALAALRHTTPAAAVIDWWLCDENAAPAAQALVARKIPLIIHTGLSLSAADLAPYPGAVVIAKPAPEGVLVEHLLNLTQKIAPAA